MLNAAPETATLRVEMRPDFLPWDGEEPIENMPL